MRLDPIIRDYPSFVSELADVLQAPTTRFYLDTSLLMWLIRVGAEARAEFLAWAAARPADAVRVPVWAAHELHRHLSNSTVAANVRKTLSEVEGKYDEFIVLAAERADERACRKSGFASRADYLIALRMAQAQFTRISKTVAIEDGELRAAGQAVIDFANDHLLDTDLTNTLAELSRVGQFRYDHRVPPGFHDKKDENRFGDLILWEEMVADMKASPLGGPTPTHAVFISRDKKTDWVSAASMIAMPNDDVVKSNRSIDQDVTLPHPLLLHEFGRRTGAEKVYITHPAFLATTLDLTARRGDQTSTVRAWLTATHRPDLTLLVDKGLSQLAGPGFKPANDTPAGADRPAPSPPLVKAEPNKPAPAALAQPPSSFDWLGLSVHDVSAVSAPAQVALYSQALPADAPKVLEGLIVEIAESKTTAFAFGNLMFDLSTKNLAGWPEELPLVLEMLITACGLLAAQQALAAFLAAGFFDRFGELRSTPRADVLRAGLTMEEDIRFTDPFETVARLLKAADAKLPYLPGTGREPVRYKLQLGPAPAPFALVDVRIGSATALLDHLAEDDPRLLTTLLGRAPGQGCTGEELRTLIAREYIIPQNLLSTDWDRKKITWSEQAGLAPLDPFSDGGLGASTELNRYE